MENKIKRPPSVWIAQLILFLVLLFLFMIPIKMSKDLMDEFGYYNYYNVGRSLAWSAIFGVLLRYFVITSPVIILFLASSIGLALRHRVGRWLGVFTLLLLSFVLVTHMLGGSPLVELINKDRYEMPVEVASALQIVLALLSVLIATQLTLFKDARIFFQRQVAPASAEPPPPPSFDE